MNQRQYIFFRCWFLDIDRNCIRVWQGLRGIQNARSMSRDHVNTYSVDLKMKFGRNNWKIGKLFNVSNKLTNTKWRDLCFRIRIHISQVIIFWDRSTWIFFFKTAWTVYLGCLFRATLQYDSRNLFFSKRYQLSNCFWPQSVARAIDCFSRYVNKRT